MRTFGMVLTMAAAIGLSACTRPVPPPPAEPPSPEGQLVGQPGVRTIPAAPTDQTCRAPAPGNLTIQNNAQASANSLVIRYNGRDPSFRPGTGPAVYRFLTSAQPVNSDGSIRQDDWFSLWQGYGQRIRICGQPYTIDLVRAGDSSVIVRIRR